MIMMGSFIHFMALVGEDLIRNVIIKINQFVGFKKKAMRQLGLRLPEVNRSPSISESSITSLLKLSS